VGISQDGIRRILGLIEGRFDEIAKADAGSPRLALSRANMLSAFADNYIELGDLAEARNRAQECVDIARPLQRDGDKTLDMARGLARCLEKLAGALAARSDFKTAVEPYEESIALRRRILAADPADIGSQLELCHILTYYSYTLLAMNNDDEALARAQESLAISKNLATQDRNNAVWMREYVDSLNMRAMTLHSKSSFAEAITAYNEAIEVARELVERDRGNATLQRFLSNIMSNLSDVLFELDASDKALTALNGAVTVKRRLIASDPENTTWQFEIAITLFKLGRNELALEKVDDAFASFREARDRYQALVDRDSANALWRSELILSLWFLHTINVKKHDVAAARTNAQDGLTALAALDADQMNANLTFVKDKFAEYLASTQPL
jgi:tetratricopeptide (TPR) repeat protein